MDREVNVELLANQPLNRFNKLRIIAGIFFVLSFLSIFLHKYPYGNYYTVAMLVSFIVSIIWLSVVKKYIPLGSMCFKEDGLFILADNKEIYYSFEKLSACKITINNYKGKTGESFSLIDQGGEDNVIIPNTDHSEIQYRFRLLSKQQTDILFDIIEYWKLKNPSIIIQTSWW